MSDKFVDSPKPIFPFRHPVLWALINLFITLYGILFKGWNLQPIVYIFWIEIILNVMAVLIRVAGAMNKRPFWDGIGLKIFFLLFGAVMGFAFILLTVVFTFKVYENGVNSDGFDGIQGQVIILVLNYIAALLIQYFLSGRYRIASPAAELMMTFVYLLVLLCLIMVITQYLAPRFAGPHTVLWTGLAVVLVKFVVDWLSATYKDRLQTAFSDAER